MPDQRFENILVVRLDNVGDVVMLTPALRALRLAYPAARITLLCSPAGARVTPMLPSVDDVIVRRAPWQALSGAIDFSPASELAFIKTLAEHRFDAAFIFTSFSQSPFPPAFACYLAGIPRRFGESKEFGGAILTDVAPPLPGQAHQVDRNLHLLAFAGLPLVGTHMELAISAQAKTRAMALLRAHEIDPASPYVVVAPGASCDARRYDPGRLAEAVRLLARQAAAPAVVVGVPADRPAADLIVDAVGPGAAVSLAGETSVPGLAAIIRAAALVVTNNSAPLHIADAFRRPVVALYSGTEYEEQWRARHSPSVLLRRPTACSPCFAFTCPHNKECLDIAPADVARAALSLLPTHLSVPTQSPHSGEELVIR